MACSVCDATTNQIRLNCGNGMHYLCLACNTTIYNPRQRDGEGRDVPGTHTTRCPLCRANSVGPTPLVPRQILLQQRAVVVDQYVPPPPPQPPPRGLYDGLPPPRN